MASRIPSDSIVQMERLHGMQQPAANISNAVILSIGIHIAILGSALAFAQYSGISYSPMMPHITVSLADWQGRGSVQNVPRAPWAGRSVPPRTPDVPVQRTEEQRPAQGMTRSAVTSEGEPPLPSSGTGDSDGSASSREGPVLEELGAGPESGGHRYSSEQWQQLYSALEKVKSYPRFARERGIEGTVLVRLSVLPSGEVGSVDIVRSSGSEILDSATVRTMYRAAPLPFVSGWIEVPMVYQLRKAEEQ